ncbi:MAG TPA: response regulator transcription factor [Lentimicrobium sp.]|nr:response regulator transcription factor [Lentimicrobium sp.]
MDNARILLVEDDHNLGALIEEYLQSLGYRVVLTANGEEGLRVFKNMKFDLCILDVMLPKKDGFTLAVDIRNLDDKIPIIFLTAKGQNDDRIKGFKSGCDDYITKPFISEELSLRIEAILKRCGISSEKNHEIIKIGKYSFDPFNQLLVIDDCSQKLTVKEAALLRLLCANINKLLPRDKAQLEVWGSSDYFIGRSMDVFIAKLRKYLSHDADVSIQNIHGSGFKLEVRKSTTPQEV